MSISLFPSKNLGLKGEKERKTSLSLLSILTIEPLIIDCCLNIRLFSDRQ